MTVGFTAATLNAFLDGLGSLYARLHTGDPGAAGTANGSAEATRKAMTFAAAAGGVAAQTGSVSWPWTAGAATITHVSYWTAATGGTCKITAVLGAPLQMVNGDTLVLSGCTLTGTPAAA